MQKLAFVVSAVIAVAFMTPVEAAVVVTEVAAEEQGPVLIPVVPRSGERIPGAYGSLWGGVIYFHNPGPDKVRTPQSPPSCALCVLEPGDTIQLLPPRVASDRGSLFPASGIYEARVEELSRPGQPTGVEVPVVRRADFISDGITLVGVPRSDEVRATLRVYDPLRDSRTEVLAEFMRDNGELLASIILRPGADPVVARTDDDAKFLPGFDAVYDIESAFPALRTITADFREQLIYNVRLTSLVEGTVFWGFVSVTHNETQDVLLISP